MSTTLMVATLKQELKCFAGPDSGSSLLGRLPAKEFNVLEKHEDFPTADTDYLRLATPGVAGGSAWICSRWQGSIYAEVKKVQTVAPAPADGMTIAESFLLRRLREFAGFTYDIKGKSYPWPLPGIQVDTQLRTNNCCTFVEGLVIKAWEDAMGQRLQWNMKRHQQMMISGPGNDIYSPVTALVEAGIAVPVESTQAPPPPWTVIQGWKKQSPAEGGHTFILLGHRNGKVLTLESNNSFELNGVGFRGLGNAERFGFSPPPRWWEDAKVWDWEKIRTTYKYHRLARLKVNQLQWPV